MGTHIQQQPFQSPDQASEASLKSSLEAVGMLSQRRRLNLRHPSVGSCQRLLLVNPQLDPLTCSLCLVRFGLGSSCSNYLGKCGGSPDSSSMETVLSTHCWNAQGSSSQY